MRSGDSLGCYGAVSINKGFRSTFSICDTGKSGDRASSSVTSQMLLFLTSVLLTSSLFSVLYAPSPPTILCRKEAAHCNLSDDITLDKCEQQQHENSHSAAHLQEEKDCTQNTQALASQLRYVSCVLLVSNTSCKRIAMTSVATPGSFEDEHVKEDPTLLWQLSTPSKD